jgi:hypothetical protein
VLKPLLTELTLDADAEKLLRNPAKHLEVGAPMFKHPP